MTPIRVQFDATLDEVIDTNMRLARSTRTLARQRRRSQWFVSGCLAVGILVGVVRGVEQLTVGIATVVLGVVVGAAAVTGYGYGLIYDWCLWRTYRRMALELYGGADDVPCRLEVQDDKLWTSTKNVEISFPWASLSRVHDGPDAIELWFSPGLAVVRDRAFDNEQQRREFIDAVGERAKRQLTAFEGGRTPADR